MRQISRLLKHQSRSVDEVSRNGGEEFSVLVPNASLEEASALAEKMRAAVERHSFEMEDGTRLQVTISIGVAVHPDTIRAEDGKDLLEQADAELYRAKNSGRNRVCSARECAF
nr:GGDEF domain-containing protein [Paenibacillus sp. DMB20]